jgi:hypothetical protein
MALGKTINPIISNQTVAANSSIPGDGVDLSSAVDFGIGYQLTFNGSCASGARIDLYADPIGESTSFTIGTYDDPCDSADIEKDPGHTVKGFVQMQRAAKFVKAKIVNLDSTYSITAVSLWAHVQTP